MRLSLIQQAALEVPTPWHDWLASGELRRLNAQGSAKRQCQFVAGRWLLRQLLGAPDTCAGLDIDAQGRSTWSGGHASLSHSGDWLFAASDAQAIGVDLEVLRPRIDVMGLARQVHSAAQCRAMEALSPEGALCQFYCDWTLKEAWLKAHGLGLDLPRLRQIEFTPVLVAQADSACAVVNSLGLVLSLHQPQGIGVLPLALAGVPLAWQCFHSTARL